MNTIYRLFFIVTTAIGFAVESHCRPIYLKSANKSTITLSDADYDNVKVFDKKTYWHIKKGSLRVNTVYDDLGIESILINSFEKQKTVTIEYTKRNGKLLLSKASITRLKYFNTLSSEGGEDDEADFVSAPPTVSSEAPAMPSESDAPKLASESICTRYTSGVDSIEILTKDIEDEVLSRQLTNSILDKSCGHTPELERALRNSLRLRKPENRNFISTCLVDKKYEAEFKAVSPALEMPTSVIAARLDLESAKVYSGSIQLKSLVTCRTSLPDGALANTSESGKISFKMPLKNDSKLIERQFSHELLHSVDQKKELPVAAIIDICYRKQTESKDKATENSTPLSQNKNDVSPAPQIQSTLAEAKQVASTTPQSIDPTVASRLPPSISPSSAVGDGSLRNQINMPETSYSLAANSGNGSPYNDRHVSTELAHSKQQSSGLLNFAAAATSAMMNSFKSPPVLAAVGSTTAVAEVSTSLNSNSVSRTVASVSRARSQDSQKARSAAASTSSVGKITARTIAAAATNLPAVPAGAFASALESSPTSMPKARAVASVPSSTAGANSADGKQNTQSANKVAPDRQAFSETSYAPSREEITTFFVSNNNYSIAKQRLRDSKMQRDLVAAKVSVTNLKRQNFGASASDATTHILDNGSAFVLKKQR